MTETLQQQLERELYGTPPEPTAGEIAQAEGELRRIRAEARIAPGLRQLREKGIPFESQIGRSQVIIRLQDRRTFDFWPTTGRWRERAMQLCRQSMAWNWPAKQEGMGIASLLAAIGEQR